MSAAFEVIRLDASDSGRYAAIRAEMLVDAPWAFGRSPEDDLLLDPTTLSRAIEGPESAIIAAVDRLGSSGVAAERSAEDAAEDPVRDAPLRSVAGVTRDRGLKSRHRADVWGVYTTPASRGLGMGRAVLERVLEVCRGWDGVEHLGLCCSVRAEAALQMYEAIGFRSWGIERDAMRVDGRSEDHHAMQLFLAEPPPPGHR